MDLLNTQIEFLLNHLTPEEAIIILEKCIHEQTLRKQTKLRNKNDTRISRVESAKKKQNRLF